MTELRANPENAKVLDVFVSQIAGSLMPPKGLVGSVLLSEICAELAKFDAGTLGELAKVQKRTRQIVFDSVPNLVAIANRLAAQRERESTIRRAREAHGDGTHANLSAQLRQYVERRFGAEVLANWFADIEVAGIADGHVTLETGEAFKAKYISKEYGPAIEECLRAGVPSFDGYDIRATASAKAR